MSGNKNSGRKKEGPTFIVRVNLPLKFEELLQKEAEKLGLSQNQMVRLMIIQKLNEKLLIKSKIQEDAMESLIQEAKKSIRKILEMSAQAGPEQYTTCYFGENGFVATNMQHGWITMGEQLNFSPVETEHDVLEQIEEHEYQRAQL